MYCIHKISSVGGGTSGGIKERIKKSLYYVIILKSYSFFHSKGLLVHILPSIELVHWEQHENYLNFCIQRGGKLHDYDNWACITSSSHMLVIYNFKGDTLHN